MWDGHFYLLYYINGGDDGDKEILSNSCAMTSQRDTDPKANYTEVDNNIIITIEGYKTESKEKESTAGQRPMNL